MSSADEMRSSEGSGSSNSSDSSSSSSERTRSIHDEVEVGVEVSDREVECGGGSSSVSNAYRTPEHYSEIQSNITASELGVIRQKYHIPEEFELRVPRSDERMHHSPDGCLAIHTLALQNGLRFPISSQIGRILHRLELRPTQLVPNSMALLCSFVVLMRCLGQPADFRNFSTSFKYQASAKFGTSANPGFFYITARQGKKIIEPPTSSYGKNWKCKWFFVRSPPGKEFGIVKQWLEQKVDIKNWANPTWSDADWEELQRLKPLNALDLIIEPALVKADMSPADIDPSEEIDLGSYLDLYRSNALSSVIIVLFIHL